VKIKKEDWPELAANWRPIPCNSFDLEKDEVKKPSAISTMSFRGDTKHGLRRPSRGKFWLCVDFTFQSIIGHLRVGFTLILELTQ